MDENPSLKVTDHEVQSLVHDLAHENMREQKDTAQQAVYLSLIHI